MTSYTAILTKWATTKPETSKTSRKRQSLQLYNELQKRKNGEIK